MITYQIAEKKLDDMKNIDFGLYGDSKGEIRKVIIKKLEKHLFEIDCECPEEYLTKIDGNNDKTINMGIYFKIIFNELFLRYS